MMKVCALHSCFKKFLSYLCGLYHLHVNICTMLKRSKVLFCFFAFLHQRLQVCACNYRTFGTCETFVRILCVFFFPQSELRICVLPTHVTYDAPWPIRKVPLRCTPHFLCYHPDSKVCMTAFCVCFLSYAYRLEKSVQSSHYFL